MVLALVLLIACVGEDDTQQVAATTANVTLVRQGAATAWIVTADKPSAAAAEAAKVLRRHIYLASGAWLPIRKQSAMGQVTVTNQRFNAPKAPKGTQFLIVGKSGLTDMLGLGRLKLKVGGIAIRTFPNSVVVMGRDDDPSDKWGTHYAATTLLERALGVVYLWPGPTGKVVPKRDTIKVSLNVTYSPRVVERSMRGNRFAATSDELVGLKKLGLTGKRLRERRSKGMDTPGSDWWRWQRLGGKSGIAGGHSFPHIWKQHGNKHLDWFAENIHGSRDQSLAPDRPRLDVTNRDLLNHIAADRAALLDANPKRLSVAVGPNDGSHASFCMCGTCRAKDHPDGRKLTMSFGERHNGRLEKIPYEHVSLSDRYAWFYNELAKRIGKRMKTKRPFVVVGDAYSVYLDAPIRESLHPNVAIRFAGLSYFSRKDRLAALKAWKGWRDKTDTMVFRSNHLLDGRFVGVAQNYATEIASDYRMVGRTMLGADLDSIVHHWATAGLNYYVTARKLWDPTTPASDILEDYFQRGFGAAAVHMRRYFDRLARISDEIARLPKPKKGVSVFGVPGGRATWDALRPLVPYTDKVINELRSHLDKAMSRAKSRAPDDRALHERIDFIRTGLEWTSLQSRLWRATDTGARGARSLADKWLKMMQRIFEKNHYAVNVALAAFQPRNHWADAGFTWPGER